MTAASRSKRRTAKRKGGKATARRPAATGNGGRAGTRRPAVGTVSERWAGLWDLHLPHEDHQSVNPVLQYLSEEWWDGVVLGGDLLDCNVLSAFNEGKPRLTMGQTVKQELDYANEWLDGFCQTVRKKNPKCQIIYLQGNHEERIERYLDAHPEFQGLLDLPLALRLGARGIQWVEYWRKGHVFTKGHASFIHGFSTIQHHAAKHVRDYGGNVFYGHAHDQQTFAIRRRAKNVTIKAQSMGCLCKYDQPYMRGRPMNWQHGFGIFYFWPDGWFQDYFVNIHKGRFVAPNGKQYGGAG